MFRKSFISVLFITAIAVAGISVFGQNAPVNGTVELQKADGTREPVANALIEVFRTDIKAGFPSAKTNSKGQFAFAGLPLGATFVFARQRARCCRRLIFPNVKAGQEKLLITLVTGRRQQALGSRCSLRGDRKTGGHWRTYGRAEETAGGV